MTTVAANHAAVGKLRVLVAADEMIIAFALEEAPEKVAEELSNAARTTGYSRGTRQKSFDLEFSADIMSGSRGSDLTTRGAR